MANSNSVYVYVKLSEITDSVIAGRLDFFEQRVDFRYAKSWQENPNGFSFHPDLLPLSSNVYSAKTLDGALSVFRDAGPGAWGKELIKRRYGQVDLPDYLILSNNLLRIGVLRYSRERETSLSKSDDEKLNSVDIGDIYAAIKAMENGDRLTDFQASILAQGSSMDGMRPKSFVVIDGDSWILKFPSKNDYDNKAINELIGMRLARACGIETPDVKLIPLGDKKQAVAVKRFDTNGRENYPLMSAASAMGYAEGESVKRDYRYVAQMLIRLSDDFQVDCVSLFKRMALNVMISNRDDHIFNQAMIMQNGKWGLSPVYDVVCGEGNQRNHAMVIGKLDAKGNLANVLSSASSFGLSDGQAKDIIDDMVIVVSEQWKEIARDGGVTDAGIAQIEWSILHKDIFFGYDRSLHVAVDEIKDANVENGFYRGVVVEDTGVKVTQNQGKGTAVVHEKGRLVDEVVVGRNVEVGYEGGRGVVKLLERGLGVEKVR